MDSLNYSDPLFTIQQLSRKLDIPKSTLRYWEEEFGDIFIPLRTRGGQRRYSSEHISIIREIIKLKKKGMNLASIKTALMDSGHANSHPDFVDIDMLTNRITEMVKSELLEFFRLNGKNQ